VFLQVADDGAEPVAEGLMLGVELLLQSFVDQVHGLEEHGEAVDCNVVQELEGGVQRT